MQKALGKDEKESAKLLDQLQDIVKEDADAWDSRVSGKRQQTVSRQRLRQLRLLDRHVDAEKYGYRPVQLVKPDGESITLSPLEELIRWRLFERTGGGLMVELGSHQLDAASIFISKMHGDGTKKVHPLTVVGVGGRHTFPLDRQVNDHVYCAFEFPAPDFESDPNNNRIVVTYSSINGNGFGGYGEIVMGTKGTVIIDRERDMELLTDRNTAVQAAKAGPVVLDTTESGYSATAAKQDTGPVSRGYTEEIEHWAWCIRNQSNPTAIPRCDAKTGLADAVIALVSNMAIRKECRIEFDPEWFDFNSDKTPEDVVPDVNRPEYKV